MKPDISEFSYGYALTSEIVNTCEAILAGAPVFPSLIDEGSLGYDLEVPISGAPLFIQFKLSDYMVRATAEGSAQVSVPHYRMHLRPLKHSQQHDLLLALESRGKVVFYAAPEFHTPTELNSAYLSRQVTSRSAFFRPGAIGVLPDEDEHFVCFNAGGTRGYRFSEPVVIKKERFEDLIQTLSAEPTEQYWSDAPARVYLQRVADELVSEWTERAPKVDATVPGLLADVRRTREPREYLGWVAQTLFDCAVFVRLERRNDAGANEMSVAT